MQDWSAGLHAWHDFYVFMGAAAATLMGLMFVVMSLGQRSLASERGSQVTRAFFTPIVVFFATIIVVAALMLFPDTSPHTLGALLGAAALIGLGYMIASGAHDLWRTSELGLDDLVWYVILPYASYAGIGIAGIATWSEATFGFRIAAVAILSFLLIGIRNAWDLVVYSIQHPDPH
ncbi:MAG: hypothetical protein JO219_08955 [Candidatus Eremiobacteraeota bacterium]|nr:hypothetical protein [Candidatus Eremiobacteraeota bacterium]MBV8365598.1 hypothetical protein [Candidatus Eremiobacteraeota bacterium]